MTYEAKISLSYGFKRVNWQSFLPLIIDFGHMNHAFRHNDRLCTTYFFICE
jgi:hypothetical protein